MKQLIPIPTLHLFSVLDKLLIELLSSLSPEEWNKPTVARLWTVKDIAAHLLDGNVRGIAILNGHQLSPPDKPIESYQHLVAFLNELNNTWVTAMKRVSPQLLTRQLESTGKQYIEYLHTLKPFEQAMFPVAWAGENISLNWFHIAREYTEKWHHQQQIRDALGKPGLMARQLFYPCMDTFMQALPHTYHHVAAGINTIIKITISGREGGVWFLKKSVEKWQLQKQQPETAVSAEVILSPQTAWKLFTKAISAQNAIADSRIKGDALLADTVFKTIAVMA
ncbi:maleylpyruvate isomerase N-terminal domain-containing protein [Mucilaginibacter phyllosphaerae]|uniref:Uncharacterized protein (TIGR03083 family) n=1 Tax=Mucilaginibacter phyllosphaerae TaxID=1812349 RepID=A0A4Y8ADU7_9SPHI|nr:maleylpyruvate isomerase N-terminal domain-containing protein [Mucilaginibacter phyllosphaerae]MBB3969076.1 uncharacterized protein (TIGR03083 family) [Mucilaginibacter phyllosphaerae]TEW66106.1 hypothetical protein E2R65_13390 [Mucilaginibacter phyllosphaerae]GGH06081.1 hypothetical protein GCM10007352_10210 [Mucilaginibacter phyllosphaerae]